MNGYVNRIKRDQTIGRKFNNAVGGVNNSLGDFARTLIAKMSLIDSSASGTATLFGYLKGTTDTTNAAENALVAFEPTSHAAIIAKIGSGGGFRIGSATYGLGVTDQADEKISVIREDINGLKSEVPYFPGSMRTSKDFNNLLVDLVNFQVPVDEATYIRVPLNVALGAKKATLTLILVDLNQPNAGLYGKDTRTSNYSNSPSIEKERIMSGGM